MLPLKSLKNLKKLSLQFTQQKEATCERNVTARITNLKHYMVFQNSYSSLSFFQSKGKIQVRTKLSVIHNQ